MQQPNETISDFVAQLRKISEYCRFGDQLDEMLRDRLVCGCRSKQLQCKLLAEHELSYDKDFKIVLAAETAQQEAKELNPNAEHSVHSETHSPTTSGGGFDVLHCNHSHRPNLSDCLLE